MAYLKLNLQYFAEEKTEKATPKKREESSKKGQVAKSQEISIPQLPFSHVYVFTFGHSYMGNNLEGMIYSKSFNMIYL